MATSNVLGAFLQDVIGRDEVLTPTSGKLRSIHARVAKEVEDAKQELHTTVQQQWPTLKRQYNTTIDLSDRLKAISGEVQHLEIELDGDDSALRPRLQANFTTHAQLSKRHKESDALVDLLKSLKSLQDANTAVEKLLAEGRLDEVVPALQVCEQLVTIDIDEWKKDCQPFKSMKEQFEHARNIAKERLEEALDRCIAFTANQVTLSSFTNGLNTTSSPRLSLQSIIASLTALSPLEKQFERIAKTILQAFVKPVLVNQNASVHSQTKEEGLQILTLQPQSSITLQSSIESLTAILQALRSTIASHEASADQRRLFLAYIIPPVQQLIIENILVRSLPSTADKAALDSFQQVCKAVSSFEASVLSTPSDTVDPIVQEWVQDAGTHWSNAIVQRCFAALRLDIATSDYWNKTENVDWLDDPSDKEDKEKWERWLSDSVKVTIRQEPEASSSKLPASPPKTALTATQSPIAAQEDDEEPAWEFDEDTNEVQEVPEITPDEASAPSRLQSSNIVPEYPDPDADDAWGFDGDDDILDDEDDQKSTASSRRANGHRRNNPSISSTRSRASQKSTRSSKTKSSQNDEDEDGGWSFDAEAELEEPADASPLSVAPSLTPEEETKAEVSGHSRNSSIEDAWGWSRNPDPDEDKPIGKPTKVIVSKKLGAKGRSGSPALSLDTDVQDDNSRSTTPMPHLSASLDNQTPTQSTKTDVPKMHIVEEAEPVQPKKVTTKLVISSKARRVIEIALELHEAAIAVSSASHSAVDIAASSKRLFKAYSDLLDLYRAIMPVAHSGLITTVPSIGMQFSNDCLYIARTATGITTQRIARDRLDPAEKTGRRKPIEALRRHGQQLLDEQIDLQRVPLMETLDETEGFRNTDDPRSFAQCQRCIRQIVHTLTSISHAWKPVLLKRVYFESLGILVNAVLLRVLVEIENQEDISEKASHRLNDLCKMLHELEGLFMDGEESTVALHVPVWFKFKFMSELLEASMADIMYLFNEGHLVDFSSTELSKLVRALFADSQLRQRNLETIARGT